MKLNATIAFCLFFLIGFTQNIQLSDKAEISILTCERGQNEIYSYFGHSAMRVKDPKNNFDKVYNYGTFDFDTPNFYLKFCRGKLLYELKSYDFKYFPYHYYRENRWIKTQVLNLSQSESQKVFDYLEHNALPENKKYKYDFFFDNCATKMYEVIENSVGDIDYNYSQFPTDYTHRDLIHQYFPKNSWSKFGVDLLLGSVIDKKASLKQYMFLPDYVYKGLDKGSLSTHEKSVIKNSGYILEDHKNTIHHQSIILSPLTIFSILVLLLLYFENKFGWNINNTIYTVYGITGILLLFMMLGTDHTATYWNYNALWANPVFLLFPFVKKNKKTVITLLSLVALLAITVFKIQVFSTGIIPFVILLLARLRK